MNAVAKRLIACAMACSLALGATAAQAAFADEPAQPDATIEGLAYTVSIEEGRCLVTMQRNGLALKAVAAQSLDSSVAYATALPDGRVQVSCIGSGIAPIRIFRSASDYGTYYFASALSAPGRPAADTASWTDPGTGIRVSGVLSEQVRDDRWALTVAEAPALSEEDPALGARLAFGAYDVSIGHDGVEMQPFSNLTLRFPVGLTELPAGYEAVVFHRHDDGEVATLAAELVEDNGRDYIEVSVSQLSVFEPALVGEGTETVASDLLVSYDDAPVATGSMGGTGATGSTSAAGATTTAPATDDAAASPTATSLADAAAPSTPTASANGTTASTEPLPSPWNTASSIAFASIVLAGLALGVLLRIHNGDRIDRTYR